MTTRNDKTRQARCVELGSYSYVGFTLRRCDCGRPPLGTRCVLRRGSDTMSKSRFVGKSVMDVGSLESLSFMMIRRKAKNCLDVCIGLVKKSAMLFAVETNGTSISNSSTMSLTWGSSEHVLLYRVSARTVTSRGG